MYPIKHRTFTQAVMTLFLLMALTLPSIAREVTVSAQLRQSSTAVGQPVLLTVTIHGDSNARVNIPEIEGLTIDDRGRSSNIQIINGSMTSSLTRRYAVNPNKVGTYKITPITVTSRGKKLTIQDELKLTVTKNAAPANPNTANQNAPTIKPEDLAHFEIIGLKDHAVVGELIPVEIRAFFKNTTQASLAGIKSNPTLDTSSFTVKLEDKKPRQGQTTIDGKSYYVVIFKAAISPIKAGEFELPFTMDATMRMRVKAKKRARRNSRGNDPFGDAFFDDFFTRSTQKEIKLSSSPFKINVTPAPIDGQPAGFNGAIGQFKLTASAPTAPIRAGDPITLTVRVSGKGNLSRLKMPQMTDDSGWKTYPAKNHLEGANSLASSGTKVFEQTIVPRNPSVTEIPALELVYFDPEKGSYQTTRTAPIPIKVLPGTNIVEAPEPSHAPSTPDQPTAQAPHTSLGWLRKNRLDQSSWLIPTAAGISATLLALAAGLAWSRRHNTADRKATTLKDRQIQSTLKQCDEAIKAQNAPDFFQHARHAIQLQWSEKLNMEPDAITTTDLPANSDARTVLEMADTLTFSGETDTTMDLATWKTRIHSK